LSPRTQDINGLLHPIRETLPNKIYFIKISKINASGIFYFCENRRNPHYRDEVFKVQLLSSSRRRAGSSLHGTCKPVSLCHITQVGIANWIPHACGMTSFRSSAKLNLRHRGADAATGCTLKKTPDKSSGVFSPVPTNCFNLMVRPSFAGYCVRHPTD